jgi:hypothetical protein
MTTLGEHSRKPFWSRTSSLWAGLSSAVIILSFMISSVTQAYQAAKNSGATAAIVSDASTKTQATLDDHEKRINSISHKLDKVLWFLDYQYHLIQASSKNPIDDGTSTDDQKP